MRELGNERCRDVSTLIHLVVLMYVRYPLSRRNVEDLLAARGIDICHETVRLWWNRFGPCSPPTCAGSG